MNKSNETNVKVLRPSVENREFWKFMQQYKDGNYGTQRLGQAFYNHFSLHKMDDQDSLKNLYAKDGEHAKNLINEIFNFLH